jgi:type II secretory pathway pseudopilin PulG
MTQCVNILSSDLRLSSRQNHRTTPRITRIPLVGFSMVELVVVLSILGFAIATTTIRFATPLQRARVEAVLQQWRGIDSFARAASKSGTVIVNVANSQSAATVEVTRDGSVLRSWKCPNPILFSIDNNRGERLSEIVYNRQAGTIDYYLEIVEGKIVKRVVVAGATGQIKNLKGAFR